jgi:molybdenum cofactor cytidylyltransferase
MRDAAGRVPLCGVVLAAGSSTRMGCPKLLLPLAGRPLLQHVLDAAAESRLDELVLVIGSDTAARIDCLRLPETTPTLVIENRARPSGQSHSLALGLRGASPRAAAAAVLLGDQPGVDARRIDRVARAFLAGGSPAARPVYSGPGRARVPGHPVFLARHLWAEVERLRGDAGARAIFSARPDWLLEVAMDGAPADDVDTWKDYERVTRTLGPWRPGNRRSGRTLPRAAGAAR